MRTLKEINIGPVSSDFPSGRSLANILDNSVPDELSEGENMTGLYIFVGFLLAVIAAFVYFKVKWSREDRAERNKHTLEFQNEVAAEQKRRKAQI